MNNLLDVAETSAILLDEAATALSLIFEGMESENYKADDEAWMAIVFVRRYRTYQAAYSTILRDMRHHIGELDRAVREQYEKRKQSDERAKEWH